MTSTNNHAVPEKLKVREFYNDKCIFLTGVTGFVAKVLLEKLIRAIPRFGKIYILIRAKKTMTAQ